MLLVATLYIQRITKHYDTLVSGLMAPGDEVDRPVVGDSKIDTLVDLIWDRVSSEFVDKTDFHKVLTIILDSTRPMELVMAAFQRPKRERGLVIDPLKALANLKRAFAEWQFRLHLGFAAQQDSANLCSKEFSKLYDSCDNHWLTAFEKSASGSLTLRDMPSSEPIGSRLFSSEEAKILEASVSSSILTASNRQRVLPYRDRPKSGGGNSSEEKQNPGPSTDPTQKKRKRGTNDPPGQFTEVKIPGIDGVYRLVCLFV